MCMFRLGAYSSPARHTWRKCAGIPAARMAPPRQPTAADVGTREPLELEGWKIEGVSVGGQVRGDGAALDAHRFGFGLRPLCARGVHAEGRSKAPFAFPHL